MLNGWLELTTDALRLAFECQRVIALRAMKIAAGGPAARTEAQRIYAEKPFALAEAVVTLATGGSPRSVIRRYRTHIRANARRLSRS